MLGRLRMTVDETLKTYQELSEKVFTKNKHRVKSDLSIQGRFDTKALEDAIKAIVVARGFGEDEPLKDDSPEACKVYDYSPFRFTELTETGLSVR